MLAAVAIYKSHIDLLLLLFHMLSFLEHGQVHDMYDLLILSFRSCPHIASGNFT
jgi:hypothetical protein